MTQLEAYEYLDDILYKIEHQIPIERSNPDGGINEIVEMYPDELEVLALKKLVSEGFIEPIKEHNDKLLWQYKITFDGITFEKYAKRYARENAEKSLFEKREKALSYGTVALAILTGLLLCWEVLKYVLEHRSCCH